MRDTNLGWLTLSLAVAICAGCASGEDDGVPKVGVFRIRKDGSHVTPPDRL